MKNYFLKLLAIFCFIFCFTETVYAKSEVNVYSYRQPILIDPFFEEFTKTTGIKVNVLHAKKGLLERLLSEGANTPADLILAVDISRLKQFVEKLNMPFRILELKKTITIESLKDKIAENNSFINFHA